MAENKETALTVLKKQGFELATLSPDVKDIIAEEMDGLGTIPFDTVKIPSGGGLAFEIPGEDEDKPETATELTGIILDHHAANAMWEGEYDGSNQQPDCSSFDGKTGTDKDGCLKSCNQCPYNRFGSGDGGVGKKCKNMHRLYIQRSGEPLPVLLVLPPSSLASFKNYMAKKIVIRGKRPYQVLTKITLKKEKNSNGITYSQAMFTKTADLSPAECETTKAMAEAIKTLTRSDVMKSVESFAADEPAPVEGFTKVAEEDIPF